MKKLLIPIDGSENSEKALLEGKKLAEVLGSEVLILYVERNKLPGAYADVSAIGIENISMLEAEERDKKIGEQIINHGLEVFKNYPGSVKASLELGDPAEVIIRVAEKEKVDLIVMGSRGLSGISRFVLGSVSYKVLNHTHSSVLIIR